MWIASLVIGLAAGGVAVWLGLRGQLRMLTGQLQRERESADEKVELLQRSNEQWETRFEELSAKALASSNSSFLELAQTKFTPLAETLAKFEAQTRDLEVKREGAYSGLTTQVAALTVAQQQLRAETGSLVTALRDRKSVV